MFVAKFDEAQLREAIRTSRTWAETLRKLGYRTAGGNWRTIQKYAGKWGIPTDHFDPAAVQREALRKKPPPLETVMVERSSYSRANLKRRLFAEGLKTRQCELCGQGEDWRGGHMAMILDHINGAPDDHRLENLRILCPNCAATLETHCARKNRVPLVPRECPHCGREFHPNYRRQRYCSRACGVRWDREGRPLPGARRVERPPYEQLVSEVAVSGYCSVGRKYGVTDNAIRKWIRAYERDAARTEADGD